jgi:hypothetical protein
MTDAEDELMDVRGRMRLIYDLPYRSPEININWTAQLLCKSDRTLSLDKIGGEYEQYSGGALKGRIAGGTTVAEPSFRTLTTRDDMLSFIIDWKELILADSQQRIRLKASNDRIANGGDLFAIKSIGSGGEPKRQTEVTMKFGELFGFFAPSDVRRHLL